MTVQTAFQECQSYHQKLELDWYQLSISEKSFFLSMAKEHGYKDPKHSSGRSHGYCFYLALQRKQSQWGNR